jgi:hypothetical protein
MDLYRENSLELIPAQIKLVNYFGFPQTNEPYILASWQNKLETERAKRSWNLYGYFTQLVHDFNGPLSEPDCIYKSSHNIGSIVDQFY